MSELEQAITETLKDVFDSRVNTPYRIFQPKITKGEAATKQLSALIAAREQTMAEALREASSQIQYLEAKFHPTGTGQATLVKIEHALAKIEEGK